MLSNAEFFCLTETWLHENIRSNELFIGGFEVYRSDRDYQNNDIGRGGGVLIAISDVFQSRRVCPDCVAESVCAEIVLHNKKRMLISCVYFPPASPYC